MGGAPERADFDNVIFSCPSASGVDLLVESWMGLYNAFKAREYTFTSAATTSPFTRKLITLDVLRT